MAVYKLKNTKACYLYNSNIYITELKPHQFGCGCSAGSVQTDVHEVFFVGDERSGDVSSIGVPDSQRIPAESSRAPLPEQEPLPSGQTFSGSRCRRKRLHSAHLRLPTQQE